MAKLVRDNIIKIIEKEGRNPKYRILSKKEFIKELKNKLIEESLEVKESKSKKELLLELSDVSEVFHHLLKSLKISKKKLKKIQSKKRKKKGSFAKRIFLIKQ